MTRRHPRMCLLGLDDDVTSPPPPQKKNGTWIGIFQLNWQNYKIAISQARNIGSTPNFDTVIEPHSWLRGWSRITKFIFKMADGRHIAKCWKRYNSPINGPIWMKLEWSHPVTSPTCPAWCGYHGDGRCLTTAHCTFSSYGRLEAERVNQFWWNLVYNSKLWPQQWQSRDLILIFLNSKWRTAAMLENIRNAITRLPMDRLGRNLGGRIPSCSRHVPHDAVTMAAAVA